MPEEIRYVQCDACHYSGLITINITHAEFVAS